MMTIKLSKFQNRIVFNIFGQRPQNFTPWVMKPSAIDIRETIGLLLIFLKDESSGDKLKQKYPDLANLMLTNKYYNSLRLGYCELSKFIPDDKAKIGKEVQKFMENPEDKVKLSVGLLDKGKKYQNIYTINIMHY